MTNFFQLKRRQLVTVKFINNFSHLLSVTFKLYLRIHRTFWLVHGTVLLLKSSVTSAELLTSVSITYKISVQVIITYAVTNATAIYLTPYPLQIWIIQDAVNHFWCSDVILIWKLTKRVKVGGIVYFLVILLTLPSKNIGQKITAVVFLTMLLWM